MIACGSKGSLAPEDAGRDSVMDAAPAPPPDGCVSQSGYALCGGSHDCFPASSLPSPYCEGCYSSPTGSDAATLCGNAALPHPPGPALASDGQVYVEGLPEPVWDAFPFDVGELFASNGLADRVRYADWSAWSGDALPTPTSCPTFASFTICGGNCGPCATGDVCTGRSPKHPYGFCVPSATWQGCFRPGGCGAQGCLVFAVSASDQPLADRNGICMDYTACQAMAASYPGGAYCN